MRPVMAPAWPARWGLTSYCGGGDLVSAIAAVLVSNPSRGVYPRTHQTEIQATRDHVSGSALLAQPSIIKRQKARKAGLGTQARSRATGRCEHPRLSDSVASQPAGSASAACGATVSTAPFSRAMRPILERFRSRITLASSSGDFFHHAMVTA